MAELENFELAFCGSVLLFCHLCEHILHVLRGMFFLHPDWHGLTRCNVLHYLPVSWRLRGLLSDIESTYRSESLHGLYLTSQLIDALLKRGLRPELVSLFIKRVSLLVLSTKASNVLELYARQRCHVPILCHLSHLCLQVTL